MGLNRKKSNQIPISVLFASELFIYLGIHFPAAPLGLLTVVVFLACGFSLSRRAPHQQSPYFCLFDRISGAVRMYSRLCGQIFFAKGSWVLEVLNVILRAQDRSQCYEHGAVPSATVIASQDNSSDSGST